MPNLLYIIRQRRKLIFSNRSAARLLESKLLISCILGSHHENLTHNLGIKEKKYEPYLVLAEGW